MAPSNFTDKQGNGQDGSRLCPFAFNDALKR